MATVDQTQQDDAQAQESIKIEKNTRGYNWSIRVVRQPGEDDDSLLDRLGRLDYRLRQEYGVER